MGKITTHFSYNFKPLQDCVRRRATKSVSLNPFCSGAAVKDSIDKVWDTCYKDTKPFDKVP